MASTANGRPSSTPVYIEEPGFSRWLFGSSAAGWIWLVARLWLGWEWLQAGWNKVFGGNITWKVWDWGNSAYSLTGDGNIGWVRSGHRAHRGRRPADHAGRRRRRRVRRRGLGARHRRGPPRHRLLLVGDSSQLTHSLTCASVERDDGGATLGPHPGAGRGH